MPDFTITEPRTLREVNEAFKAKQDELKRLAQTPFADLSDDDVQRLPVLNRELNDLGSRRDDLQKAATVWESARGQEEAQERKEHEAKQASREIAGATIDDLVAALRGEQPARKSLGQMFVDSPTFKQYDRAARRGPASEITLSDAELKATLTETGFAPQAVRTGLILPGLLRRPTVADLIPQGTTAQNAIVYMEETTTTNGVAPTAEGAAKPESTLVFTERTAPVRKIAGILKVSNELMDDVPAFRSYIEQRLRLFLQLAEENQLLSGSGTAPEITGILNTSGILTQAKSTDSIADAIFKATIKIEVNSFLMPSGIVMHPTDWQTVRLSKNSQGSYLFGDPYLADGDRIFGYPVVETTAMTVGTALTAAFDTALQIFRRNEVAFDIATQNEDDWKKNIVALRIEERLALAVYRPTAICTVTGL